MSFKRSTLKGRAQAVRQDMPPLATHAKKVTRALVPRAIRNWLRSPSASAKWAWDGIKFSCGIKKVVEMRPGWSLICHPAAYRCAYYAQQSDPEQRAEFDGFINNSSQGMILFDVGAHFGLFSFASLHYGGPGARAIAIDPSPTAIRFLTVQAKLNQTDDRLRIFQASVGDQTGRQRMISVGVLASGYYVAPTEGHSASELSETSSVTLDCVADELKISPTHIKIDVEGFEAAVLRGGQKIFSRVPAPIIFLEAHNQMVRESGGNPAETLILLRDYGYQTFTSAGLPIGEDEILNKPLIRIIARKPPF
jgi:FkbM family methyltransferase